MIIDILMNNRWILLDVLVCNAGVMSHLSDNVSEDGLELHFSVNYLGHFFMLQLLKKMLKKSSEPRIIVVSSILLKEGVIDLEKLGSPDIERYKSKGHSTPPAYCDTKLMCSLFVQEIHKREPWISAFCVSPGWCKTNLGEYCQ